MHCQHQIPFTGTLRIALLSLALISILTPLTLANPASPGSKPDPLSKPYLNSAAIQAGKLYFGTATQIPGQCTSNTQYMSILNDSKIFGQLTPTNAMKWDATEPSPGTFNFGPGSAVVGLAEANGQYLRCHNLVWSQQLPNWVTGGNWTNATLIQVMERHITALVTHWSTCRSWDVVNEALASDGSYVSNIFYQVIGPAYVPLAFSFAAAAAAKAGIDVKLFYNEYGIEYPGPKANAALALVKDLKRRGVKIDGVGFESHFLVGETPSMESQVQSMRAFAQLGVEVQVSELDVRFTKLPPGKEGLALQAGDYYDVVAACVAVKGCTGMTVWDFDDEYSWIPPTYPGEGRADLYNANLSRKPAYRAVWEALRGINCTVCG